MSDWNKQIIEEFRANDGKVGGTFANVNLVLLHTIGSKTGLERINPMVSFEDGDRLIVVASKGGAQENPDWFNNLVANPDVVVEYGVETYNARATVVEEPERSRLYQKMTELFETFANYEKQTDRVIPVVALSRVE